MSTQTLWFLIVVISCSFDHQTMIFACISLQITSIPPQVMKIRLCSTGFSCLSVLWGSNFGLEWRRVLHVANAQHLNIPACIDILPSLVCQHCCCYNSCPLCRSTNSWLLLLLQVYLRRNTFIWWEEHMVWTILMRGKECAPVGSSSPLSLLLLLRKAKPCSQRGISMKLWACVSSWNFTLSLLCRMWVTYLAFKEPCYSTLKS